MTIDQLIKDYNSVYELAEHLDRAMLSMVILLRYEPEQLKDILSCYQHLYLLRQAIINPNNKQQ